MSEQKNATMLYKAKFCISAKDNAADIINVITEHIKLWLVYKWNKNGKRIIPLRRGLWEDVESGFRFQTAGQLVSLESSYYASCFAQHNQDGQHWACVVEERPYVPTDVAMRSWISEFGIEMLGDNLAEFSFTLSYRDRAGFSGAYLDAPKFSIPPVIESIITDPALNAFSGPDTLLPNPRTLTQWEWSRFEERITDPARKLPYILIVPYFRWNNGEREIAYPIDPFAAANLLRGNALVFYSEFPDEFKDVTSKFVCETGMIRVYPAGNDYTDVFRGFDKQTIQFYREEKILNFLTKSLAENAGVGETFFTVDKCRSLIKDHLHRKSIRRLRDDYEKEIDTLQSDGASTLNMAVKEEEKRVLSERFAESLMDELEEAQRVIYDLKSQIEQMKSAYSENSGLRKAVSSRFEIDSLPRTVEDVVKYFSSLFSDRIAFTKEAMRSLKECTIPAGELFDLFYALATTMNELYCDGSGDVYAQFRQETGFDVSRGEGNLTRKNQRLMRQFEQEFDGETVDIEPHYTFPKYRQSVHFGFSAASRRIVIGHCGKHLENGTTARIMSSL